MIYYPRETLLVRQARAAGLPATGGLGMLIEQGALAFTRWTGCAVERKDLWQACGY
jgi:shikimate dehydrogenase